MKRITSLLFTLGLAGVIALGACESQDPDDMTKDEQQQEEEEKNEEEKEEDENEEEEETPSNDISILAEKLYNDDALTVTIGEEFITIISNDEPDHKSMYYGENHPLYEAYDEPDNPDFKKNPNSILTQNIEFTIPRFPEEATHKQSTAMGPIGVSVNSVVFFNQQAAPGDDILEELNTFDQYEGHPQQQGMYHYHTEPVYLTETLGDDQFMGFLLDGFPVYGPMENGVQITNNDLDDYHGHFSATEEFPDGIYHYHITDDLPWINGDGYYGTPGTVTF